MTSPPDNRKNHLADRIFSRIDGEGVVPRPRWEFVLKNFVFWGLGVLTILLGACVASAGLFEISDVDWPTYAAAESSVNWFFAIVPLLWIATLILFLLVGYVNIRRTKHGYRYSLAVIALGTVLTSLTLGFALYASGFGEGFETRIRPHLPHQLFLDRGGLYHYHRFDYDD